MTSTIHQHRITFKKHIGRTATSTFCGNAIAQPRTYDANNRLHVAPPQFANCRGCITHYYLANPLTEKRTKVRA